MGRNTGLGLKISCYRAVTLAPGQACHILALVVMMLLRIGLRHLQIIDKRLCLLLHHGWVNRRRIDVLHEQFRELERRKEILIADAFLTASTSPMLVRNVATPFRIQALENSILKGYWHDDEIGI